MGQKIAKLGENSVFDVTSYGRLDAGEHGLGIMDGSVDGTSGLGDGDLCISDRVIVCQNILSATVMILARLGVSMSVVASVVPSISHFPSIAWVRRTTTKDGNVDTSPSQILSRGADIVEQAENP